jgi:hypothetical protein
MQSFVKVHCFRPVRDKHLKSVKLIPGARLNAWGVMEYEAWIATEDNLIVDVMKASLTITTFVREDKTEVPRKKPYSG